MLDKNNAPWSCPKCGESFQLINQSYICKNNHCYDISKYGYTNLLISLGKGNHGDDRLMVKSRTSFLNKGYYKPLADAVSDIICEYVDNENSLIIDAGCGEGYYTKLLSEKTNARFAGVDISKDAIIAACKRSGDIYYAVASTSNLPFINESADVVLNIFSPLFHNEFRRVLKYNGSLIRVVPGVKHLFQLKQYVYENPYDNPEPQYEIEGFELSKSLHLEYDINIPDNQSIVELFKMTPYYYKTGESDQMKLNTLDSLITTLDFHIIVNSKIM